MSPRAGSPSRAVLALLAMVGAALALGGCGGGDEEATPDTAFAEALGTVGEAVSPTGTGFGWVGLAELGSRPEDYDWAADAVGPGAEDLLRDRAEIRARTGFDPGAAEQALSVGGSYTYGLRLDGVAPARLELLYRRAGASAERTEGWIVLDLGEQLTAPIDTPLESFDSLGARVALSGDASVFARTDDARLALVGGGPSPLSDPAIRLATRCLGEVAAARTFPGTFTHNAVASPDLLAVGVRAPSGSGRREVLCALDESEEEASGYRSAMEETFGPEGVDVLTGEPIAELVDGAEVDTIEEGGLHAARAELTLAPGREPGLLFDALTRGSLLTYVGAAEPIPQN